MNKIEIILNNIKAQGKVEAEDLRELSKEGVSVYSSLLNKPLTYDDVKAMVEVEKIDKNKIPTLEELEKKLEEGK